MNRDLIDLDILQEDPVSSDLPYPYQLFDPVKEEGECTFNFSFTIPETSEARLSLYDSNGDVVVTIVDERLESGFHSFTHDLSHIANGIYICIFTTSTLNVGIKLILKDE